MGKKIALLWKIALPLALMIVVVTYLSVKSPTRDHTDVPAKSPTPNPADVPVKPPLPDLADVPAGSTTRDLFAGFPVDQPREIELQGQIPRKLTAAAPKGKKVPRWQKENQELARKGRDLDGVLVAILDEAHPANDEMDRSLF